MGGDLRDGFLLERPKLPLELRFNRRARVPFVPLPAESCVPEFEPRSLSDIREVPRYAEQIPCRMSTKSFTLLFAAFRGSV